MVLAAIALVLGSAYLWRREGMRKQAVLMLIMAVVMAANVAIWAWPDANGNAPITTKPE
jgi:hypothetical protein